MKPKAVHHVNLTHPPGEEGVGRAFYCDLLGFAELEKPASLQHRGGFWITTGNLQIHFSIDTTDFRTNNRAHVAFMVKDLPYWKNTLLNAGFEAKEAIPIPGFVRFYSRDPFGNRIEFLESSEVIAQ